MVTIIISRIFDPFIVLIVLFLLTAVRSGVVGRDLTTLMTILCVTMILPPMFLLFWAVKTKRVTNWDVSDQKQRIRALLIFSSLLFFDFFILQSVGTPLMQQFFLFLLVSFFGFFLITIKFKISGHMWVTTMLTCMLLYWYGWVMAPLVLLIPLVGWSRFVLKRHTMGEVAGGVIYSMVIFFLARGLHLI